MKTLLMHRDRDFDLGRALPWNEAALTQDLELDTLFKAMADGDAFLFDVAKKALFSSLWNDLDTILYRQGVLRDCLRNPAVIRDLYALAVETIDTKRKLWLGLFSTRYPSALLSDATNLLDMLVIRIRKLRDMAREHASRFESDGFRAFFAMIERELDDEYISAVEGHLAELRFPRGIPLSAGLGDDNEGINYLLRRVHGRPPNWFQRVFQGGQAAYTFRLHPRDNAGARILQEMRNSGLNLVANALAQSADHVISFFVALRTELAFYVGCLNLHEHLTSKGEPVSFPHPAPPGTLILHFRGLYDVCLSLLTEHRIVGNSAEANGKRLVIITGANQGGKSVFLRSVGLAQMMMQCGMFVGAESFEGELCTGLFTHYKREEDATMKNGKLDEELVRMSAIADHLAPNSLLLCNESFAATNDREGSEIARQIVRALLEGHVKVLYVTHLYEFARGISDDRQPDTLFLRAEREQDGRRTFRLIEGEPLETSYGEDLYREVFTVGIQGKGENMARGALDDG